MQESVLNLGEKIVLAARLAAIEHVRQALVDQHRREVRLDQLPGDEAASTDGPASPTLGAFVREQWRGYYDRAKRGAA
jgi:hypothetical protein